MALAWLTTAGPVREYQERPIDGIGLAYQSGFASLMPTLVHLWMTNLGNKADKPYNNQCWPKCGKPSMVYHEWAIIAPVMVYHGWLAMTGP